MNAHRINMGQKIALNNKSKDFFFLPRNDVQVIYKHMIQLITEKLPTVCGSAALRYPGPDTDAEGKSGSGNTQ